MAEIKINLDKCKGCLLCVAACPKGLIKSSKRLNKRGVRVVWFSGAGKNPCTACAMCAMMCPDCAIEVYKSA